MNTTNTTNQSRLARSLATDLKIPYQRVLTAVRAAAAEQVLPARSDELGNRAAYAVVADRLTASCTPSAPRPHLALPDADPFRLGTEVSQNDLTLSLADVAAGGVIAGEKKVGKTLLLRQLGTYLLSHGWEGILVDALDEQSPSWAVEQAEIHDLDYTELMMSDPAGLWLNPLAELTPESAAAVLLHPFENVGNGLPNPDYMLSTLLRLADKAHRYDPTKHPTLSLYDLAWACIRLPHDAGPWFSRAQTIRDADDLEDFSAITDPFPEQLKSLEAFGHHLASLFNSESSRSLLLKHPSATEFTMDTATTGLTYVNLKGDSLLRGMCAAAVLNQLLEQWKTDPQTDTRRFLLWDVSYMLSNSEYQSVVLEKLLNAADEAGVTVWLTTRGAYGTEARLVRQGTQPRVTQAGPGNRYLIHLMDSIRSETAIGLQEVSMTDRPPFLPFSSADLDLAGYPSPLPPHMLKPLLTGMSAPRVSLTWSSSEKPQLQWALGLRDTLAA